MGVAWTYQQRLIRCGKPACRRCAGGAGHGPYWYGFRRRKGGRVERKYFGKREPRGAAAARARREGPMDYKTALRVFGLSQLFRPVGAEDLQRRYQELAKRHHPDKRGGSTATVQRVNAAYEVLSEALRRRHGGAGS